MNKKVIKKMISASLSTGILGCPAIMSSVNTSNVNLDKKDNSLDNETTNVLENEDSKTTNSKVEYLSEIKIVSANEVIKRVSETGQDATGYIKIRLVKEYEEDNMTFKKAYHIVGSEGLVTSANTVYEIGSKIKIDDTGEFNITRITEKVFGQATQGKLIISNTLTHILWGFYGSSISEIDFSKAQALTVIGKSAFGSCDELEEVVFPNNPKLQKIEDSAFSYCNILRNVDLSGATSLNSIGAKVFSGCLKLGTPEDGFKINCPSLKYLGEKVFENTNSNSAITKIDLSNTSITEIGANCFEGNALLTEVVFPRTLQRMYKGSFTKCPALTTVNLDECENLYRIDGGVFEGCALTSVVFPKNIEQIGNNAFSGNENLENIDFTKCTKLKILENYAFANCPKLSGELWIPSSVRSIGACAFGNRIERQVFFSDIYFNWTAQELTSLDDKIDLSIDWHPNIGTGEQETKIHVLENTAQYYYGVDNFFDKIDTAETFEPWIEPSNLLQGEKPYSHETIHVALNDILSFDNGANIQGDATLDLYTDEKNEESYILTSLTIASLATDLSITINDSYQGKKITAISSKCVRCSGPIKKLILPSDLLFIGREAFAVYNTLGDFVCDFVDFSKCSKLERICESAFNNCSIKYANINKATSLRSIDYRAFFNSDCEGIEGFDPDEPTKLDLSNLHDLKSIEGTCFWGCFSVLNDTDQFMDLILPDNIEYIGSSSFSRNLEIDNKKPIYDSKIQTVDMTNCKALKKIGTRAFYVCQNLETVLDSNREGIVGLPEEIEELGDNAFGYTKVTGKLIVPKNLQSINNFCFERCNLTEVDFSLAKNLKFIGKGAFNRNYLLQSINLEEATSLKIIGESSPHYDYDYVFGGCESLTGDFSIPNSVEAIQDKAFAAVTNHLADGTTQDIPGPTFTSVHLYWSSQHLYLDSNEDGAITLGGDSWYPNLSSSAKVYVVDGTEDLYPNLNFFPQQWLSRFPKDPSDDKLYAGIKFVDECNIGNISTAVGDKFTNDYANIITENIKYINAKGETYDLIPDIKNFSFRLEAEDGTDLSSLGITIDSNGKISINAKHAWTGNIRIIITESKYGYQLKTNYFNCKISPMNTFLIILGTAIGCVTLIGLIILIILLVKRKKNKKSKSKKRK